MMLLAVACPTAHPDLRCVRRWVTNVLTGWLNKTVTELPKFDGELRHEFSLFGDFKPH